MAKALGIAGLLSNMIGAVCLWKIVPPGSTSSFGSVVARPFTPLAKIANKIGWPLLFLGFTLQLVATVLGP